MTEADRDELGQYRKLGTPDEISDAVESATAQLREYHGIGSPDEIRAFLDRPQNKLKAYEKTRMLPEDVEKAMLELEQFRRLGTLEQVNKALSMANEAMENGTLVRKSD